MTKQTIKFKKLSETAVVPFKAHKGDAGFDLFADEDVVIPFGETVVVPTNIALAIPEGYVGDIRPRSGLTLNSTIRVHYGTIDSNYRGNIGIIVENGAGYDVETYDDSNELYIPVKDICAFKKEDIYIDKGDKIAQMVILPLPEIELDEVENLDETDRGDNGFGSTGV